PVSGVLEREKAEEGLLDGVWDGDGTACSSLSSGDAGRGRDVGRRAGQRHVIRQVQGFAGQIVRTRVKAQLVRQWEEGSTGNR
ncbi:hypothetical protein, partial [Escherichia coli]|uniref:hypothetical protein n=1 Tax=Escherichia coli TaxID=562 RepID=UPI001BC85E83